MSGIDFADLAGRYETPLYVYDGGVLLERAEAAAGAVPWEPFEPLFAVKANANPHVIALLREAGWGADVASPGEAIAALAAGVPPERMVMTGSNLSVDDMAFARARNITVNLDSLSQVETWGERHPETEVWLRLNPEIAPATHPHLATAGPESKFGIRPVDVDAALDVCRGRGLVVRGLHSHIGSMLSGPSPYVAALDFLLALAGRLKSVETVDVGGGMGIDYAGGDEFPLEELGATLAKRLRTFADETGRRLRLALEPGRWVVAPCGYLVVSVTAIKRTAGRLLVGVDCPFTQFPRPAIYGAGHRLENASRPDGPPTDCTVVGNACESTDVLARDVTLPEPRVGDLLVFRDAGAYCFAMASCYNGRPLPAEVLVERERIRLIRRRQRLEEMTADCGEE